MRKAVLYFACALLVAFCVNVVLVAVEAPEAMQPFYWSNLIIVKARNVAGVVGDWTAQCSIYLAKLINRFSVKLAPAFVNSAKRLVDIALFLVFITYEAFARAAETLRESPRYTYLVSPTALFVFAVVNSGILLGFVIHRWWRPAWWRSYLSVFGVPKQREVIIELPATPRGRPRVWLLF